MCSSVTIWYIKGSFKDLLLKSRLCLQRPITGNKPCGYYGNLCAVTFGCFIVQCVKKQNKYITRVETTLRYRSKFNRKPNRIIMSGSFF